MSRVRKAERSGLTEAAGGEVTDESLSLGARWLETVLASGPSLTLTDRPRANAAIPVSTRAIRHCNNLPRSFADRRSGFPCGVGPRAAGFAATRDSR